jgi:hypothetical protein
MRATTGYDNHLECDALIQHAHGRDVCLGLTSVSAQQWLNGRGCRQGDADSGIEDGKRNTIRTHYLHRFPEKLHI